MRSSERRWWRLDGKMSSPRSDGTSGYSNGEEDREELIAAILSSSLRGEKPLTIFLDPLFYSVPLCPCHPPLPSIPPSCTPPLLSFTLSFLSSASAHPSNPPSLSLQEAVVNQVCLPQSLWSSLCPRSLAEAGVVRRRRAADGGSAVNHCH